MTGKEVLRQERGEGLVVDGLDSSWLRSRGRHERDGQKLHGPRL